MADHIAIDKQSMIEEVRDGLSRPQKTLPSKYFYDERGSRLFEMITNLPEYYLTRTETAILKQYIGEITEKIGMRSVIIELGSGSSKKTRLLLDNLDDPVAYIPIDISREYLLKTADLLEEDYPELYVQPVVADYTQLFELPELETSDPKPTAFYPGSTIGNFERIRARRFLRQVSKIIGDKGSLLIGVDLKKDKKILEDAYNDAAGVTAVFNKNILRRLNRELGTDFVLEQFEHEAFYNQEKGRIEMHLVSRVDQAVHLDEKQFEIKKGESIHTENSYKFSIEEFEELVEDIYRVDKVWTDKEQLFSVQYLSVKK